MSRQSLFNFLLEKLGVSREEVLKHQEFYNNHFDKYENDVYADIKTRLVHLLNFWEDGFWFNERFNLLFKYFNQYEAVIDFGYGLPYLSIRLAEKDQQVLPRQILVDKYGSAEKVSREILNYLKQKADFVTESIESESVFERLEHLNLPNKKLFVALETVEHLEHPEQFWKNLKTYAGNDIIVSLPIGPKIPSHTLHFDTVDEAKEYLSNYIEIKDIHSARPGALAGRDLDKYQVMSIFGTLK